MSKQFTKRTFNWLRQIKADHILPRSGVLFALQVTEQCNERHGGAGWASCRYIANAIGMSEATVINLFHLFEKRGHLKVEWGKQGRGHSNRYWMVLKPHEVEVLGRGKSKIKPQIKPQPAVRKPQPAEENCLKNRLNAPKGAIKTEREGASRAHPDDGAGGLEAAAPSEKGSKEDRRESEVSQNAFAQLTAIWQRGWLDDDDERAAHKKFAEACQHDEPEKILAGARAWVAAADAPRFLKPLSKWLAARGWEKSPPAKRHHQKHNHGRSLADAMREAGERRNTEARERGVIHYKD